MTSGHKKLLNITVGACIFFSWAFLRFTVWERSAKNKGEKILHLYSYNNYFPDNILKGFENQFHCRVQYDYFSSNEEMLAKIQAGASGYDVVVASDYVITALISGSYVKKLNKSLIPNLKFIAPWFQNLGFDPESLYTVPYKWGTTGVVYNTDLIQADLKSWDDVFQSKYSGKISLLDDEREAIGSALQSLGYSINSRNPEELKKAKVLFLKRKPMIHVFSSDSRQLLQSAEVWIAQTYSGDAMQLARDTPRFKYFNPREGGTVWVDNMVIPTASQNSTLGHHFINYILDPVVEEKNVRSLFYSSPNIALNHELSSGSPLPEILRPMAYKSLDKMEFLIDLGIGTELWDEIWTEIKSD